jgi:Tol biopolymer transport system component
VTTGEKRRVTYNLGGIDHAPAFAPDGKSLAFTRCVTGASTCDVWVMDLGPGATDKGLHKITRQAAYTRGIAWMPNSRELVYSAATRMSGERYLWRVATNPPGTPEWIEMGGSSVNHPSIPAKGGALVYTSFDPGSWHLMMIDNFR